MMFSYNFKLAAINLKHRMGLTALTIAAIAIGLALLTTMNTMSYQTSKIPIKDKADQLFTVSLDSREAEANPIDRPWRTPDLTYRDAENLINADTPAEEQTYLWKTFAYLNVDSNSVHPRQARIMAGQANFFSLFDVPFLYGGPWSPEADQYSDNVIVLSKNMNDHFFGGENSVGRQLNINANKFTVIGVLAHWRLPARFYDRSFHSARFDDAFVPASLAITMNLPRNIQCWEKDKALRPAFSREDMEGLKNSECRWIHFWAKLTSDEQKQHYQQYLNNYVAQQKSFGRFPRPIENQVLSLKDTVSLMSSNFGVSTVFEIMSFLFFLVCLINTIGILLAKYMSKLPEIALRRALGAKRHVVMAQYLIEIALISFIGGILGIILSHFGLQAMMKIAIYQSDYQLTADAIRHAHQLDWFIITIALLVAVGSTLLISLIPIWKICNTPPAGQLKSQ